MKISGRTVAYLIIILIVLSIGGITLAGAQGFPPNPLPVPVEESGIVEVVQETFSVSGLANACPTYLDTLYQVPSGKRLIIEHVTAAAWSEPIRRAQRGRPATLTLFVDDLEYGEEITRVDHMIAVSNSFPISGGGPITMYANPGDYVYFSVACPRGIGINDRSSIHFSFTGRLVPHPHPSMIPTATPPPGS